VYSCRSCLPRRGNLLAPPAATSTTRGGGGEGECREGFSLSAGGRRGCPPAAPKTFRGREGGSNHAHVTARTPTPPIAPNAPFHTLRVDGHQQYRMTQPRRSAEGDSPSAGGRRGCPLPLYKIDHMFYNSRARDPAFSAAAHRHRRSINPERPSQTRRKIKNRKPSNNQAGEL
jgi:hypothetical protein